MKVYLFLFDIANYISGAPIYYRNKIQYLEERGWHAEVFSGNRGRVFVHGLEKYEDRWFPCLQKQPTSYTRSQRKKILAKMLQYIDQENCEEIVIETGTDYTAYWGEWLAKALNAKHFHFLLDENNPRITGGFFPFYEFKYNRGELACITNSVLKRYFSQAFPLREKEPYQIGACCSNSVEVFENDFSKSLCRCDYNIGSIGRLEKVFVPTIVQGIEEFADAHPDKTVQAVFIGGTEQKGVREEIEKRLNRHPNVKCIITGFMWPIPQSVFSKIDVFASSAGSVYVSMDQGIPTVDMNIISGNPIGVSKWEEDEDGWYIDKDESVPMKVRLEEVLIGHVLAPREPIWNPQKEWETFCQDLDMHLQVLSESDQTHTYFDIETLPLMRKGKVFKIIHCMCGIWGTEYLHGFYRKVKNALFHG